MLSSAQSTRGLAIVLTLAIVTGLTGCSSDQDAGVSDSGSSPATSDSGRPASGEEITASSCRCGAGASGDDGSATGLQVTGDFDGDGVEELFRLYADTGRWYAYLEFTSGCGVGAALDAEAHQAVVDGQRSGWTMHPPIVTDLDLDGRAEGWVSSSPHGTGPDDSASSTTFVYFEGSCELVPVETFPGSGVVAVWTWDTAQHLLCMIPGGALLGDVAIPGGVVAGDTGTDVLLSHWLDVDAGAEVAAWRNGIQVGTQQLDGMACVRLTR